jgi:hypothetical protein
MSRKGITVKVECWVNKAERHETPTGHGGWELVLACGHAMSVKDGPAPVDFECHECETWALAHLLTNVVLP